MPKKIPHTTQVILLFILKINKKSYIQIKGERRSRSIIFFFFPFSCCSEYGPRGQPKVVCNIQSKPNKTSSFNLSQHKTHPLNQYLAYTLFCNCHLASHQGKTVILEQGQKIIILTVRRKIYKLKTNLYVLMIKTKPNLFYFSFY